MTKQLRCLGVQDREPVLFLPQGGVRWQSEGEVLTVVVSKEWTYAKNRYMSGRIISSRIEGGILSPIPLDLYYRDEWDSKSFTSQWEKAMKDSDKDSLPPAWVIDVMESGKRPVCEMQQVIPWEAIPDGAPDNPFGDPIFQAVELYHGGDPKQAFRVLQRCLQLDTRCIDAYVHLGLYRAGDMSTRSSVEQAVKNYLAGISVGNTALPQGFDGVLPWSWIDNRPYLRALHGLGVCYWNLGDVSGARRVFERTFRLNPDDHQGIRLLLGALDEGLSYLEFCRQEKEWSWSL